MFSRTAETKRRTQMLLVMLVLLLNHICYSNLATTGGLFLKPHISGRGATTDVMHSIVRISSHHLVFPHSYLCLALCVFFAARLAGASMLVRAIDAGRAAVPEATRRAVVKRDIERRRVPRPPGRGYIRIAVDVVATVRRRGRPG